MAAWKDTPLPQARPGQPVKISTHAVLDWWDVGLLLDRQGVGLLLADDRAGEAYLATPESTVARLQWAEPGGCEECVYWSVTADRDWVLIEYLTPKQRADIEATYAPAWAAVRLDVATPPDDDDDDDDHDGAYWLIWWDTPGGES